MNQDQYYAQALTDAEVIPAKSGADVSVSRFFDGGKAASICGKPEAAPVEGRRQHDESQLSFDINISAIKQMSQTMTKMRDELSNTAREWREYVCMVNALDSAESDGNPREPVEGDWFFTNDGVLKVYVGDGQWQRLSEGNGISEEPLLEALLRDWKPSDA